VRHYSFLHRCNLLQWRGGRVTELQLWEGVNAMKMIKTAEVFPLNMKSKGN
jgi:hypothetical protein